MCRCVVSVLLPLILLLAGSAHAVSLQTLTLEGTVSVGFSSNAALGGFFQSGVDRMRITFVYDAATPEVGSPGNCCSSFVNAVVGSSVTVLRGGAPIYSAVWTGGGSNQSNVIRLGSVLFDVHTGGNLSGPAVNGQSLGEARFESFWPAALITTADTLPLASSLDLAQASKADLSLSFSGNAFIHANADTAFVPEPGPTLLLALGLLGLGWGGRPLRS